MPDQWPKSADVFVLRIYIAYLNSEYLATSTCGECSGFPHGWHVALVQMLASLAALRGD